MQKALLLAEYLEANPSASGRVVDFDRSHDRLYQFDFTAENTGLDDVILADLERFSQWVNRKLRTNNCRYGIGGYLENRTIYARSAHFGAGSNARTLHLGTDIWGDAGLPIYCPLPGTIHSFRDNNNFGDYGPAIIIEHNLDGLKLHSLYGHLSRKSLEGLEVGQPVAVNQQIAALGNAAENGTWPPHLHFQLIFDMEGKTGDYPGVCHIAEKEKYSENTADPQLLLQFPRAVNS
jgi:murein DD-endopeptidase MepM/ murein hydrolase activator NlpD